MRPLGVAGIPEPLGDDVVAESDIASGSLRTVVARARGRKVLIYSPGHRTVVDDDVVALRSLGGDLRLPPAPLGLARIAHSHADVLEQDVVGGDVDASADEGDARRWRGLPRDGDERLRDDQRLHVQIDDAGDL